MEVVIRDYLYKNYDFLNKVLVLDDFIRTPAITEWKNNDDIYANLVVTKKVKYLEDHYTFIIDIDNVYKNIQRIKFDKFFEKYTQEKDIKRLPNFTYAIYKEKSCPNYEFNNIWKSL